MEPNPITFIFFMYFFLDKKVPKNQEPHEALAAQSLP
jgi:hypothetical protein